MKLARIAIVAGLILAAGCKDKKGACIKQTNCLVNISQDECEADSSPKLFVATDDVAPAIALCRSHGYGFRDARNEREEMEEINGGNMGALGWSGGARERQAAANICGAVDGDGPCTPWTPPSPPK